MESSTITFSPTLTVAAFGSWYFFDYLKPGTRSDWQSCRRAKIRHACRGFRTFLKREPTIADLTRENLVALLANKSLPHFRIAKDVLRTLRKQAILAKLIPGKAGGTLLSEVDRRCGRRPPRPGKSGGLRPSSPPLADTPGTLWHLCLTRFFPTNIRIRADITRRNYRYAIAALRDCLHREPTPDDLTEENVLGTMVMLRDVRGLEARTVNGYRSRLCSLWTWCAKKRIANEFPTVGTFKEKKRIPKAWTREQIDALFAACDRQRGSFDGIPCSLWWTSLHMALWDSSERIGAMLDLEWQHVDFERGLLAVPAEIRKGDDERVYTLHPDTLAALREQKAVAGSNQKVWPWPYCESHLWNIYRALRADAGLPPDNQGKSGFHRMRRSVASHLIAAGADATAALGHSSAALTRKSYIDPSIAGQVTPAAILFRPTK